MRITAGLEKLRAFSKKQHEIVSDLALIEHVTVADVDSNQMVYLSIADVRALARTHTHAHMPTRG